MAERLDKRVEWLDEQRRKDAELIARLSERVESLEEGIRTQSKQLGDLSGELARIAGALGRLGEFDEALSKHRQEISRQLGSLEERIQKREAQREESQRRDLEEIAKRLTELKESQRDLRELREAFDGRMEEEIRLTRELDTLAKRLDEVRSAEEGHSREIASLQESHGQSLRRVAELQGETSEIRKKVDELRGTLDTDEDRIRRVETKLSELEASEAGRREAQALWIEQQGMRLVEFEKAWKAWEERFVEFERRGQEIGERMLTYDETFRNVRTLQQELGSVIERLERRINEVGEMHRLAQERIKLDWAAFQADDQKRWNTYKLTSDERWRDHTRQHKKIASRLDAVEETVSDVTRDLSELGEAAKQRINELLTVVQEWVAEVESRASTSSGG